MASPLIGRRRLGAFNFGVRQSGFGDPLNDPILPPVSGASFIKFAIVAASVVWIARYAFK